MIGRRNIYPFITIEEVRVVYRLVYIQLYSRGGISSTRVKILGRRRTRRGNKGSN